MDMFPLTHTPEIKDKTERGAARANVFMEKHLRFRGAGGQRREEEVRGWIVPVWNHCAKVCLLETVGVPSPWIDLPEPNASPSVRGRLAPHPRGPGAQGTGEGDIAGGGGGDEGFDRPQAPAFCPVACVCLGGRVVLFVKVKTTLKTREYTR